MSRKNQSQFNQVNPELAHQIGAPRPPATKEEMLEMQRIMRRKAVNQLSVSFIVSMVQGRGDDFNADKVIEGAFSLAEKILDYSDQQEAALESSEGPKLELAS